MEFGELDYLVFWFVPVSVELIADMQPKARWIMLPRPVLAL
jgi:hypothetical protein